MLALSPGVLIWNGGPLWKAAIALTCHPPMSVLTARFEAASHLPSPNGSSAVKLITARCLISKAEGPLLPARSHRHCALDGVFPKLEELDASSIAFENV